MDQSLVANEDPDARKEMRYKWQQNDQIKHPDEMLKLHFVYWILKDLF